MTEFRAFQAITTGDTAQRSIVTVSTDDLPADGALVRVEYSSVNYKDGLAALPTGRVAQISPLIPGIDLTGILVDGTANLTAGTPVIAHGYEIGVSRHGGFADYARVPANWLVPLPDGLTTRDAMVIGTAGFTAAASVIALVDRGLSPDDGPVLVTGATGGVGSISVNLLSGLGYEVVASTGTASAHNYLTNLGAARIIDRGELAADTRPLNRPEWAAAVDCVGGPTLAHVLTKIAPGGAVAASGLAGGNTLATTVLPFILRGISLIGIDSVMMGIDQRRHIWSRLATDLRPRHLSTIGHDITLDDLDATLNAVLAGTITGRAVVALG